MAVSNTFVYFYPELQAKEQDSQENDVFFFQLDGNLNCRPYLLSNGKNAPGCLGYVGDYTAKSCGDYNKSLTTIRIPIN